MKICKSCILEKSDNDFYKHKQTADGLYPYCKPCTSIKAKARYEKNKEDVCRKSKAWREANKEKASDAKARHRQKNKEKLKKYYDEWISSNRDVARKHNAKWASANKDRYASYSRNRRSAKLLSGGTHSASEILEIFTAQRGLCANCLCKLFNSGKQKYHVDHIMPLSLGGSNWPNNLQCLCPSCNLSKGAKHPDAWAKEQGRLL